MIQGRKCWVFFIHFKADLQYFLQNIFFHLGTANSNIAYFRYPIQKGLLYPIWEIGLTIKIS